MAKENDSAKLSPTVSQVIDQFIAAVTADDAIDNGAVDRLNKLLLVGTVPKPDEINTALFEPPTEEAEDGEI